MWLSSLQLLQIQLEYIVNEPSMMKKRGELTEIQLNPEDIQEETHTHR